MPSDANGVYSLPSGYLATTGDTIQASQHNPPLEDLASSMSARLMRSGAAPMTGPIKIVDGAVGAPAVQFTNGSSTGFYKTTTGIGVSIGGTKVAEFLLGGLVSGAHWIGELIPWTLTDAPALTVKPYGQTLSRTTYADLWVKAQIEIANGNGFYNNGDGSTTFGIGDMRGRSLFGKDDMGGTAANRVTSGVSSIQGNQVGGTGGAQSHTLALSQLPAGITSSNGAQSITVIVPSGDAVPSASTAGGLSLSGTTVVGGQNAVNFPATTSGQPWNYRGSFSGTNSIAVTSNNTGGLAHNNMPPAMICNFILFAGA